MRPAAEVQENAHTAQSSFLTTNFNRKSGPTSAPGTRQFGGKVHEAICTAHAHTTVHCAPCEGVVLKTQCALCWTLIPIMLPFDSCREKRG